MTFATGWAKTWSTSFAIAAILAHLGANVPLDEVVDLIEPHERPARLLSEVHGGVDEELLGQLEDRAVRATNVLARTSLRAEARDDLDEEVDLVGQEP